MHYEFNAHILPKWREKPLLWIASAKDDYTDFPPDVQWEMGFELYLVQTGQHPPSEKPLKGLGSGVLELTANDRSGTYRTVYAVRFEGAIYVLAAFQKKSKRGIETPKSEIDLVGQRLKAAEADWNARRKKEKKP